MRADRPASHQVLSAPQQIAAAIKRDILDGVLKPGDKLPGEEGLAAMFGVSRPTVRAGLQELCASRILAVRRGRNGGYHVDSLSLNVLETSVTEAISLSLVVETLEPAQFLEVRFGHELLVAELAAVKRTEASLARLDLLRTETFTAGHDARAAFELDLRFHQALAEATENPLLVSFEGAMIAVLRRLLGDGASISPEQSLGGVEEVVEAVRASDSGRARTAMQRHLSHAASYYAAELAAITPTTAGQ